VKKVLAVILWLMPASVFCTVDLRSSEAAAKVSGATPLPGFSGDFDHSRWI